MICAWRALEHPTFLITWPVLLHSSKYYHRISWDIIRILSNYWFWLGRDLSSISAFLASKILAILHNVFLILHWRFSSQPENVLSVGRYGSLTARPPERIRGCRGGFRQLMRRAQPWKMLIQYQLVHVGQVMLMLRHMILLPPEIKYHLILPTCVLDWIIFGCI